MKEVIEKIKQLLCNEIDSQQGSIFKMLQKSFDDSKEAEKGQVIIAHKIKLEYNGAIYSFDLDYQHSIKSVEKSKSETLIVDPLQPDMFEE